LLLLLLLLLLLVLVLLLLLLLVLVLVLPVLQILLSALLRLVLVSIEGGALDMAHEEEVFGKVSKYLEVDSEKGWKCGGEEATSNCGYDFSAAPPARTKL
jgi:uncharacterized membrane protein